MNLYAISKNIEEFIESVVDPETGEISEDASARLDSFYEERDQKILNTAKYIKNRSAYIDAIKSEMKSLADRAKREERKIEWLGDYAKSFMDPCKKYEDAQCSVSLRRSSRIEISSLTFLPVIYKKTKVEVVADKKAIGDAIKNGEEIPGACVVENYSLQIK